MLFLKSNTLRCATICTTVGTEKKIIYIAVHLCLELQPKYC